MTNMEKFFGFKVTIIDELEPIDIIAFKDRAIRILSLMNFNPDEYFAYYHRLNIDPKDIHFGVRGGISERLDSIKLSFSVNPKQKKNKKIRFYNYFLDNHISSNVIAINDTYSIKYIIEGKFLSANLGFSNEIITFVAKDVLPRHRKIKISIEAYPTNTFFQRMRKQESSKLTQFDFKFKKPILLKQPTNKNYNSKLTNTFSSKFEEISIPQNYLKKIQDELHKLHLEMKKHIRNEEELLNIEVALNYVKSNDSKNLFNHLKRIDQSTFELYKKIGIPTLLAIIEKK